MKSPFEPLKHYVFNYKPRYYDPRKERFKRLKNDKNKEEEIRITKNNLKDDWVRSKRHASSRGTIIRMAIIITILVVVFAYLLGFI